MLNIIQFQSHDIDEADANKTFKVVLEFDKNNNNKEKESIITSTDLRKSFIIHPDEPLKNLWVIIIIVIVINRTYNNNYNYYNNINNK